MSPPTIHGVVENPGDRTIDELLAAHTAQLTEVIDAHGVDATARQTGLDRETIAAIADGDAAAAGRVDLETVATVLATQTGAPPAAALRQEALDELLFGMTAGVLNVDVVAGELDSELGPREVQQVLEGRHPVALRDYLELQQLIESRTGETDTG